MVKVSSFIIGTILGSLFIVVFALFLQDANDCYAPPTFDNSTLETFNKLDDLKQSSDNVKEATSTIKQDPTVLDVIGGFFKSGYAALITAGQSFDTFLSMSNAAKQNVNMGDASDQIYNALKTIVIVLLFIGVFMAAILKWVV